MASMQLQIKMQVETYICSMEAEYKIHMITTEVYYRDRVAQF